MQIQTYNIYNIEFIQGSHCFYALSVNSLMQASTILFFTLSLTPTYSIVVVANSVWLSSINLRPLKAVIAFIRPVARCVQGWPPIARGPRYQS